MLFSKKTSPGSYETKREGKEDIIYFNYDQYTRTPSVESDPISMAKAIESLIQVPSATKIVFNQKRNYEYGYNQTKLLSEISAIYNHFVKQKKILTFEAMGPDLTYPREFAERQKTIQNVILNLLKTDPIGAYITILRELRNEKIKLSKAASERDIISIKYYLNLLSDIFTLLDNTQLISLSKYYLPGYSIGNREIYRSLFRPTITPDFMHTRLMADPPLDGEEIDAYSIDNKTNVMIFNTPRDIKPLYHLIPPEFKISEDKYALIDLARNVLSEHQPKAEEFTDPERMRTTFFNIGRDLLTELAFHRNMELTYQELDELAQILVRYTVGFGLIETLLQDEKVQDIVINSPIGQTPIYIVHADHEDCVTNIIPSKEDGDSWASKFRLISARPLDEANPILDTELVIPGARARVAIISTPLNPHGLAYAIRRHRDDPWTLPLFIKQKMLTPLAAGLLSFIIDGARTLIIAGTRSSGKTSLLGASLVELMRKYRIITIEDSVTGDTEILSYKKRLGYDLSTLEWLFESSSKTKKLENINNHEVINKPQFKIFAINNQGKIKLKKVTKIIRHKVNKPIYEITTSTGRIIKVTGDHSLFKLGEKTIKEEVKVSELKIGNFLATPYNFPIKLKERTYYDITKNLVKYHLDKKIFVSGKEFNKILLKYKNKIKYSFKKFGYTKVTANRWIRDGFLPLKMACSIGVMGYVDKFKLNGNSEYIPTKIELDKDFLAFVGLWLADGCYDRNSIIMSVSSSEEKELVNKIAKRFGFTAKLHSDKFSLMINSKSLKFLMKELIYLKGNAYTKYVPCWVLNLSREQKASFLKGLFSGDGCVSDKEVIISLASRRLLSNIQTLLLNFGIIFRINSLRKFKSKPNDRTIDGRISSIKFLKIFKDIGFLQKSKNTKLTNLVKKISTHDSTDIIPLPLSIRAELTKILPRKEFNQNDYNYRKNNVGKEKLKRIISALIKKKYRGDILSYLKIISKSDIFWDKIVRIRKIKKSQYVYDLSVPGEENFICNNILAHNTLELPTDSLRQLGYNIQIMKVRSALVSSGSEVAADEGIRTSLRLGDSSLIVGEIRSKEAMALYEAMRIGALANLVAGTIHGDSPYGVFDRVVNDLKVPRTSFKATDIIVVCNPVKSPDGLHKVRRVTQITEVTKEWEKDPLLENGFVDLMKYNPKTDMLEPTDALINGESTIIKSIAGNIREWAGNWDAVWENILLRAKIKEAVVKYAEKIGDKQLLEAKHTIYANDLFHKTCSQVKEKTGKLDPEKIFHDWDLEIKKYIKKEFNKE